MLAQQPSQPVGQENPPGGPYIIGSLLYGANEIVSEFVRGLIPTMHNHQWGTHVAIGVLRGDELVGGVVYHNYRYHDIEFSGAFTTPRWCLPQTLRGLFQYPFEQLGCVRMTTVTARNNKRARRMDEGLGFRLEGCLRKAFDGKQDAMIYGLMREHCKFLKGRAE